MGLTVGRVLPTGETVIRIYRGGFGEVGVLEDEFGGLKVLKRISDDVLERTGEPVSTAFFEECRIAANQLKGAPRFTALAVNSMSRLEDLGPVLFMEYVDGPALHNLVGSGRRQSLSQSLRIGGQLAEALDFAHRRNVRHRDIKPSNILLTRDNQIRLIDWGLSRAYDEAGIATRQAAYMSPERQANNRLDDAADDVYALGVILFECLTGGYPRETERPEAFHRRLVEAQPLIPSHVAELVVRTLDPTPERRPSATEIVERLRAPGLAEDMAAREIELPFCRACGFIAADRHHRCPICDGQLHERVARPPRPGMIRIRAGVFHHGLSDNQVTQAINSANLPVDPQQVAWLSPRDDPPRRVYIPAFDIDETPVTNQAYLEFVEATNYPMPEGLNAGARGLPDHPVVNVTWRDALCYALWAGKRLPTPMEWEKAARGDHDDRAYPWGDVWQSARCNHAMLNKFRRTSPVTAFREGEADGRSPFGVADMAGNVGEWVSEGRTSADSYAEFRAVCGGGWCDPVAIYGMVSTVRPAPIDYQGPSTGFRCVADLRYEERPIAGPAPG
jgi:formylglycine-generating enzyme required for sulfatase activity